MIDYSKTAAGSQRRNYDDGLRQYLLKVYNYMSLALLMTAIVSYLTLNFPPLAYLVFNIGPNGEFLGSTGIGTLVMLAPIGIAFYFFSGISRMSLQTAHSLFWAYAALTGVSFASFAFVYTGESIVRTFFICSSVFGAMSIYGYSTKKDLTSIGSFLIMGLFGIIIASIVNLFLRSEAIHFATSFIGVAIFMGVIAWDTQKIKNMYYHLGGGEMAQKMSILSALTLYLDFINLFIYLLRFFGQRKD